MRSPLLANIYLHYVFDLWAESDAERMAKSVQGIVGKRLTYRVDWYRGERPSPHTPASSFGCYCIGGDQD